LTDAPLSSLKLLVMPLHVRKGETISACIDAANVAETIATLHALDTVVISQPHTVRIGAGTFRETVTWVVDHVQQGTTSDVEITVSDGRLTQKGQCRVAG
jgi:hypothetical protein